MSLASTNSHSSIDYSKNRMSWHSLLSDMVKNKNGSLIQVQLQTSSLMTWCLLIIEISHLLMAEQRSLTSITLISYRRACSTATSVRLSRASIRRRGDKSKITRLKGTRHNRCLTKSTFLGNQVRRQVFNSLRSITSLTLNCRNSKACINLRKVLLIIVTTWIKAEGTITSLLVQWELREMPILSA